MGIFNRNRRKETRRQEDLAVQPSSDSRVEVELHKAASADAAKKAVQANKHLNELLVENGFTLKIYLAAGGQLTQKKQGGKK